MNGDEIILANELLSMKTSGYKNLLTKILNHVSNANNNFTTTPYDVIIQKYARY